MATTLLFFPNVFIRFVTIYSEDNSSKNKKDTLQKFNNVVISFESNFNFRVANNENLQLRPSHL